MVHAQPELALLLHALIALAVVLMVLGVAFLMRARPGGKTLPDTDSYESGMPVVARRIAPVAVSTGFLAIAFMLFDLEVMLLATWAVAARTLGTGGLIATIVFIAVLGAALVYLWADGALDVGPGSPR